MPDRIALAVLSGFPVMGGRAAAGVAGFVAAGLIAGAVVFLRTEIPDPEASILVLVMAMLGAAAAYLLAKALGRPH